MLTGIITKSILIHLVSFLLYLKLTNISIKQSKIKLLLIGFLYVFCFSLINYGLSKFVVEPYKSFLIIVLSGLCLFKLTKQKIGDSIIMFAISHAVSVLVYLISIALSIVFFYYVFGMQDVDIRMFLLSCAIESAFILFISKTKVDLSMSQKRGVGGIGLAMSGFFFLIYGIIRQEEQTSQSFLMLATGLAIGAIGIIYWLKRETVIAFNDQVKRNAIKQKDGEIESLNQTHDKLAARVHADNKRLPAIQTAVAILANESTDSAVKTKAQKILEEIEGLRKELSDAAPAMPLPTIGIAIADAIMLYLFEVAQTKNIKFELIIGDDLKNITEVIKPTELETLIADLIENAIIATDLRKEPDKKICVYLHNVNNAYELTVKDSGIPFEKGTLEKLGRQKTTTHADSGGSGLGYMTIFKILDQTRASITIEEYLETQDGFTKSITIRFDSKHAKHLGIQ